MRSLTKKQNNIFNKLNFKRAVVHFIYVFKFSDHLTSLFHEFLGTLNINKRNGKKN